MAYDSLDFRLVAQGNLILFPSTIGFVIANAPTSYVLEIYGNIPITYQGSTYLIIISIVFPPLFPNVAPVISFINPDGSSMRAK